MFTGFVAIFIFPTVKDGNILYQIFFKSTIIILILKKKPVKS